MTPSTFIIDYLNIINGTFKNLSFVYGRDKFQDVHLIQLTQDGEKEFEPLLLELEERFASKFHDKFPGEEICFYSSSEFLKIERVIFQSSQSKVSVNGETLSCSVNPINAFNEIQLANINLNAHSIKYIQVKGVTGGEYSYTMAA